MCCAWVRPIHECFPGSILLSIIMYLGKIKNYRNRSDSTKQNTTRSPASLWGHIVKKDAKKMYHSLPSKKSGAWEVLFQFSLREAHSKTKNENESCHVTFHLSPLSILSVDQRPNVFLRSEGEWKIDPRHRHPVNLTLPARPGPPSCTVRDSTHVHIVAPRHQTLRGRKRGREISASCYVLL